MRDVELRFEAIRSPAGEMRADHAAAVSAALDTLFLRLTREAASAAGPGRPGTTLERLGEVRLRGVAAGSTRLLFRIGDADALVDPLEEQTDALFRDLVAGIQANEAPSFTTPTIREATLRLVGALKKAAPIVEVTAAERRIARIVTAEIVRDVWQPRDGEPQPATIAGRLEALDFRNGHFRLVDDVGNRIDLEEVDDPDTAADLANQRVQAEGKLTPATNTSKERLTSVRLRPYALPGHVSASSGPAVSAMPTEALDVPRLPDEFALTEAELREFLATIHQ